MSSAVHDAARSAHPEAAGSRSQAKDRALRLVRPAAMLLGGLAIAFTATLHERLAVDSGLIASVLMALAIGLILQWIADRGAARPLSLLGALWALGCAAFMFTQMLAWGSAEASVTGGEVVSFGVVTAVWAVGAGLLEFLGLAFGVSGRADAVLLGVLSFALALVLMLVVRDPVAIVGFFGGYCVVGGIFLGISVFDRQTTANAPDDGTAHNDVARDAS